MVQNASVYLARYTTSNICPLRCLLELKKDSRGLELRYQDPLWINVYRRFYFIHLQLATRRFYYGEKFGISTEALSYTQVRTNPKLSSCPEITSLFSTDAQICPKTPGLCLRIQQITMQNLRGNLHKLCLSAHTSGVRRAELYDTVVKAYISGNKAPSSTYTCRVCTAESLVDLALVLTTWINLGPDLTPDDPRWIVHSCGGELSKVTLGPNHRKDSSRVCFENVSPRSLEALRSCNLSYLKDQRFKRVMCQVYWGKSVWYLPPKGSWGNYWFMS
ncbi:hypothetical protein N7449_011169 [Penicillium cf. viridicatum]|uniref:Uncharacterized protein n=1 Tax=Penicillium cf. viridicatum TaxID=2972119 RepID=A0A9W9J0X8_9EURO|nr:hypothetical protein N7449_011169 [Penicillium cf. viridicatum]